MSFEYGTVDGKPIERVSIAPPPPPPIEDDISSEPLREMFFIFRRCKDGDTYKLVELTPDMLRKILR